MRAGCVCRQWLALTHTDYARHVVDVHVVFEEMCCDMQVVVQTRYAPYTVSPAYVLRYRAVNGASAYALVLTMCQCEQHVPTHAQLLRHILTLTAHRLHQLIIEDYLLLKTSFVHGDTLEALLGPLADAGENTQLRWIEMHNVDLSRASVRVLLLIGRMKSLGQLSLMQCGVRLASTTASLQLHDRLYAAMLCATLGQLQVTGSPAVTDRLLRYLSRACPSLWRVDVGDCRAVTARGVAHFCETLHAREPHQLFIRVKGTQVRGNELQQHLLCPVSMPIGCTLNMIVKYSPAHKHGPWSLSHVATAAAWAMLSASSSPCLPCMVSQQHPHKQLFLVV